MRRFILAIAAMLSPVGSAQAPPIAQVSPAPALAQSGAGGCTPVSNDALTMCVPPPYRCYERSSDVTGDPSHRLADWAMCLARDGRVITFEFIPTAPEDRDLLQEMLLEVFEADGEPTTFAGGQGFWTHSAVLEPQTRRLLRQFHVGVLRNDGAINVMYVEPYSGDEVGEAKNAIASLMGLLEPSVVIE